MRGHDGREGFDQFEAELFDLKRHGETPADLVSLACEP
jgi:hypothetical protein